MILVYYSESFIKWLNKLKDCGIRSKIIIRLTRIETTGNLGDYKSLGDGLYEIRIDYGVGYRLYFIFEDEKIIVILYGGDKSSQNKDITKTKKLLIIERSNYENNKSEGSRKNKKI